jgi:hypothetical protein
MVRVRTAFVGKAGESSITRHQWSVDQRLPYREVDGKLLSVQVRTVYIPNSEAIAAVCK